MIMGAEHVSLLQDYWNVLSDPAHVMAEVTVELAQALLLYPVFRKIVKIILRNHDKIVHDTPCAHDGIHDE